MIEIIKFELGMKFTNLEYLSRGVSTRYLECMRPHDPSMPLIAVAWRRKAPSSLPQGRLLVDFK